MNFGVFFITDSLYISGAYSKYSCFDLSRFRECCETFRECYLFLPNCTVGQNSSDFDIMKLYG